MALTGSQAAPASALIAYADLTTRNGLNFTDGDNSKAPVVTLSAKEFFPYHSTLSAKFFAIPLELRQQIYSYVFYAPDTTFQKTIKGWRDCPFEHDINYTINETALLAVSHRIRAEALPIFYRDTKFRLHGFEMLRDFLGAATMSDNMNLHIRRVSLVKWEDVLSAFHRSRMGDIERGTEIIAALSDLPSLRLVELSARYLPMETREYENEPWFGFMDILRANGGCLRVVGARIQHIEWDDWQFVGGRNFGWSERVLMKTSVDIRDWNELVEANLGDVDFAEIMGNAMSQNWRRGPLKSAIVQHGGREYKVLIWGVPENVRRSEERKEVRREAKKANEEQKKLQKGKTSPLRLADSDDEGSDDVDTRARKTRTREEARTRRMEKQRGIR